MNLDTLTIADMCGLSLCCVLILAGCIFGAAIIVSAWLEDADERENKQNQQNDENENEETNEARHD